MAERTLRERCIEAAGSNLQEEWPGAVGLRWEQFGETALDAILGVLRENIDNEAEFQISDRQLVRLKRLFPHELLCLLEAVSDD